MAIDGENFGQWIGFVLHVFILQKVPQVFSTYKLVYLMVKSYLLLAHKAIKIAL